MNARAQTPMLDDQGEDNPPCLPPALERLRRAISETKLGARTVVDDWCDRTGGIASQYRSTNGVHSDKNLELVLQGRDRLVVGITWELVYYRAAVLIARNPELLPEPAEDES